MEPHNQNNQGDTTRKQEKNKTKKKPNLFHIQNQKFNHKMYGKNK